MKKNNENELEKDMYVSEASSDITDLESLVNIILDYYLSSGVDEGEEWKKGTAHENKPIPSQVDDLVSLAFQSQLKKFIKS